MAQLHDLVTINSVGVIDVDLIVVGPRMSMNIFRDSEPLGVSRQRWAHVPLALIQNKMCA